MKKAFFTSQSSKNTLSLIFIAIIFTMAANVHAQTITVGPGGRMIMNGNVSLVVNNAAIVNNGAISTGVSTVSFRGHTDTTVSYLSGNPTTFYNLTISKSAYGIALKARAAVKNILSVTAGNLYTDSNLVLLSDNSLTARVSALAGGSSIVGKAHVERYLPARRAWRLMTAPVTASNTIFNTWQIGGVYATGLGILVTGPAPTGAAGNGLDASSQNNVSLKKWNVATQQLNNITNTKVSVSAGNTGSADNTGYFVFIRGDRNTANTNITNSNVTTITSIGKLQTGTQTFSAGNIINKFTLVGNPYASPVDFNNVTISNLVKRFYVWDPNINEVGGYVMLDDLNSDGIFMKTVAASTQTKDIQSSQAFFVQTNANAAASITFNESSKSANNNNTVFRPANTNTPAGYGAGMISTTLYLLNTDNTKILADGAFAEFDNIYNDTINLEDALKFGNTNENLSIVRSNNVLAAERRPAAAINDTLYLRITKTVNRSYQLVVNVSGLTEADMSPYLIDSYLNTATLLSSGDNSINFTSDGSNNTASANRFSVVFNPTAIVLPVTIERVSAYKKNEQIEVEWKVSNEINIIKYDVEKSTNGTEFIKIGTANVTGANNAYNTYNLTDVNAAKGINYYRIKVYDKSGEIKYSAIVKVAIENVKAGNYSIYPNPVTNNVINLVMNNQAAGTYHTILTNNAGQIIHSGRISHNGNNGSQAINPATNMAAGIYHLEIIDGNNNHNTQQVFVK